MSLVVFGLMMPLAFFVVAIQRWDCFHCPRSFAYLKYPGFCFRYCISDIFPGHQSIPSECQCSYQDYFVSLPLPLSFVPYPLPLDDEATLGSLHVWSPIVMTTSLSAFGLCSIALNMKGKL